MEYKVLLSCIVYNSERTYQLGLGKMVLAQKF